MAHSDTNTKLRIIKREVYSMLQRDEELIEILLEELTKQGSESSTIVESFRQNKNGALGSELLGALKQVVDLESLIVRRCWDLMRQDWYMWKKAFWRMLHKGPVYSGGFGGFF